MDECLEPESCSQICTNEKGGFKCSCVQGYLRDPQNLTRCKAAEGHASLLFARQQDIRKVALDRQEMTSIVNDTKMATALDFVFRTGMIFWSDVRENKIYKYATKINKRNFISKHPIVYLTRSYFISMTFKLES